MPLRLAITDSLNPQSHLSDLAHTLGNCTHPLQPVAAGEVILRVPLRLAITDSLESEPQIAAALPGGGRLWQDRLASKLLRLVAEGEASAWHPYIQVRR